MLTKMSSLIHHKLGKPNKYNILTRPTHGGYQSLLSKTGQNFYMAWWEQDQNWGPHLKNLPENTYLIAKTHPNAAINQRIDIVLCQNRLRDYDSLFHVAKHYNLPLIILDHTEPPPGITKKQLELVKNRPCSENVFITHHNRASWGSDSGVVIRHGIDTNQFKGWHGLTPTGLSVVNHFAQRDIFCGWKLWQEIAKQIPIVLVGENPGLSEPINNTEDLIRTYQSARYFINTSQHSPIPLSLIEAMAVGCPVITTPKQEIGSVITHKENGFIAETADEFVEYAKILSEDYDLAKEIGQQGRKTIQEQFSMDRFVHEWNGVFDGVYSKCL
jgi:hypothetical protein